MRRSTAVEFGIASQWQAVGLASHQPNCESLKCVSQFRPEFEEMILVASLVARCAAGVVEILLSSFAATPLWYWLKLPCESLQ